MSFKDFQLIKPLLKSIEASGYSQPTLVQERSIPIILEGKDLVASANTGTGKTASFVLPILQQLIDFQDAPKRGKKIRALILSPTRELAVQTQETFKVLGQFTNLRSMVVFGGTSIEPQIEQLKKGVDILVATPGRLLDLHKQDYINLDYIQTLVLDEADLMLNLGFLDDVKKVERLCPKDKQTLLFSATIPEKIEQLGDQLLKNPERVDVTTENSTVKEINQSLYYVTKRNKISLCQHLLRNQIKGNVLIFRRTKFGVEKLEERLAEVGYKVDTLHGNKNQSERQTALNKFKNGYSKILIATDVASRGIDIDSLDNVLNFDLPNVPETYVHRIGRTGRAGETGMSFAFCSPDEKNYVKAIETFTNQPIPVVDDHPYPMDPNTKSTVHKKKGSKYKKGRKGEGAKSRKKRWY
ncbi:DEAD/DEAH box helicase [Winogradskyella maritima]|uniref:DEAD/DEAH box helicase n=1 Tax=Winogradskyella maritima TaxID=1517766 RepID=A0ABV8AK82_9FLAO|nr:DEAD/DEAH box helicase [Winogradskyella maritima]